MPIIGIMASANWSSANASSYESIATVTVSGSSTTTVTFSSIPGTYKHLQIRGIARNTYSGGASLYTTVTFNNDTGTNYSWHTLRGNGTSALASGGATTSSMRLFNGDVGDAVTSGVFAVNLLDIIDYASTSKYKTMRSMTGCNDNTTSTGFGVSLSSGLWQSTSALTRIDILNGSDFFKAGTTFALYGIKG